MKTKLLVSAISSAIIFAACNSNNSNGAYQSNSSSSDSVNSMASASASKTGADSAFMYKAADAGMMEIELGNYAMKNSQNKDVKNYASMMVADHTKAADELKGLASSENVTLPSALTTEHQEMVASMEKMSPKDFNKHYIDMMVSDHKKVIDAFKNESQNGKDSTIVAFASRTLPVLQKHLDSAQVVKQAISQNQ